MKILSSTGLSIPDLINLSSPANNDLLLIQDVSEGDSGLTKNITISQLSTAITSVFFNDTFNLTNTDNVFSGSFYGTKTTIPANFHNIIARNNLTVNNNTSIAGTLSVSSTSTFSNNVTISSGNLVVSSGGLTVSTGNLSVSSGGLTVFSGVSSFQSVSCGNITSTGTITAATRFVGNIRGDLYSPTDQLVLDNGSGAANQSLFYGTSSFSTKSDYVNTNGLPLGGTSGQVLSKDSGNDYDVSWGDFEGASVSTVESLISSSISGSGTTVNYFPIFENANKLKTGPMYFYNSSTVFLNIGIGLTVENSNITITNGNLSANQLTGSSVLVNGTISASNGSIYINDTGLNMSYIPNITVNNVTNSHIKSSVSGATTEIHANLYSNKFFELELSQSCNVTMSLNNGQSGYILVKQETGEANVIDWQYSIDEGDTILTGSNILWESGTLPTLTTGGKDLIEFFNFGNTIYGKYTSNYS